MTKFYSITALVEVTFEVSEDNYDFSGVDEGDRLLAIQTIEEGNFDDDQELWVANSELRLRSMEVDEA